MIIHSVSGLSELCTATDMFRSLQNALSSHVLLLLFIAHGCHENSRSVCCLSVNCYFDKMLSIYSIERITIIIEGSQDTVTPPSL